MEAKPGPQSVTESSSPFAWKLFIVAKAAENNSSALHLIRNAGTTEVAFYCRLC